MSMFSTFVPIVEFDFLSSFDWYVNLLAYISRRPSHENSTKRILEE